MKHPTNTVCSRCSQSFNEGDETIVEGDATKWPYLIHFHCATILELGPFYDELVGRPGR